MAERDRISRMYGDLGNPGAGVNHRQEPQPRMPTEVSPADRARDWVARQGRVNAVMGLLGTLGMEHAIPDLVDRVANADTCIPLRTLIRMETGVR